LEINYTENAFLRGEQLNELFRQYRSARARSVIEARPYNQSQLAVGEESPDRLLVLT
jgi:hypothetical protein